MRGRNEMGDGIDQDGLKFGLIACGLGTIVGGILILILEFPWHKLKLAWEVLIK